MIAPLVVLYVLLAFGHVGNTPLEAAVAPGAAAHVEVNAADAVYERAKLSGIISREVFDAAYQSVADHELSVSSGTLAIADMSQPSTAKRLVVVDLGAQEVVLHTYVAHGQGSGGLMAQQFSNKHDSHQTSLGLYRVGARITSPKHGPALLLHGLDAGLNDQARAREVIIHGADYVSEQFIAQTGRLGRSWGCPAVPRKDMTHMIGSLADGGLLFVHAS
jgi:hypothetical protein